MNSVNSLRQRVPNKTGVVDQFLDKIKRAERSFEPAYRQATELS